MAEPDTGGTTKESSPAVAPAERLPSERELELEVLLKERDEHLTRLANEVRLLRRHLPVSEQASTDDTLTLPPAVTNLVLPLLSKNGLASNLTGASGQALSGPASATVTAALTARLAALHQENEELYELLKRGAVGRLREEVRELRVTARRLEGALQESHTIISQLKTELEESYRALERVGESSRSSGRRHSRSHSPINHYKQKPQSFTTRHQPDTKPIPTGPRALKKPRLSDPSQEYPSSGYRSNGRSTPPVSIKKEEDFRMKVEDDDYDAHGAGGRDDDQYSDYHRPKSEQYSQSPRSRSPTPKRLGSEGSDWDRPKSRSRSRSHVMNDRSPSAERSASPRRSQGRRDSYSPGRPQRSRSPAARSRSRSAGRPARSPTPPSPDADETRTPTRSYSRTRSSVHSPVSRRRSLSRTKSSPRSSRRYSRSPPRQRRSPTQSRSPPRRSRSPSRLRIHGAARRLEDRRERSLRPPSPTRSRGGDRRPDTRAERERERGHRDSKGKTNDREKEHRGGGNNDAFGNGRRRRQGKGSQKHGGSGAGSGSHATRNGSNPSSGVGSLASRIQ